MLMGISGSLYFRRKIFIYSFWIGHAMLPYSGTDIALRLTRSLILRLFLAGKVRQRTPISAIGVIVKEMIG